ncbi:reverse transcriptase [Gossypium australe]|uniref:Reverse transcriptase n=1 Tax=Gossypium australe TaxID=47621 RepID=A0A5B6UR53_9ROSI|nr:reverse transcriptase [Gossypium australe]
MKSLSWNVRGLGSPRAVRRLRYLIKQQNPRLVFLMETKLDKKRMEKVRKSCGLLNCIEVEAEGTHGGLCLAWKDDIEVTSRSFSKWHMDVLVKEDGNQEDWRFTGLYGSPYLRDQNLVWNLLKRLSQEGGLPRDHKRMEIFRDTLEECNLMGIGYSRVWYTWERGNLSDTNIRERLDRGVANEKWRNLFPLGSIHHFPYSTSDHCPLIINTDHASRIYRVRDFHFEVWWTMEDTFEATLKEFWESSSEPLVDKLRNLQIGLTKWANIIKGKKGELQKRLTKELESLIKEDRDDDTLRANSISKLTLDNGEEISEESAIEEEAKLYFENLFTSKGVANPREILEGIEGSISVEVNERLQAPFKEEEVRLALKGMGPTKVPGPDGFPAIFFQKYWHIVGNEVLGYCLGVLNEGREADSANSTNIVLISKVHKPTSLVNFRPISLCTVLYKIVAKTIANRMQKRTGKKGYMAVKLDMSKAYDRVEWDFIKEVMNNMGFARNWIELIMRCVTSVSYAVIINGSRGRTFKPSRGLREGDPLSPYLFLICSEGLSALMRIVKKKGLIRGAKASRKGPEISHLLFANDCMMFGEATEKGVRVLKDILQVYESCSGQCVKFGKSTVFYSTNTNEESKAAVLILLGVRSSSSPEKYLGLPNMVGKRKTKHFKIWMTESLREYRAGVLDYCP